MGTKYATATIKADRNQHSFKLSLKAFMAKRGAPTIVAQGRRLKAANAALFASIEKKYGVPAGRLIAIWGMETAFGNYTGSQNVLSATATLAYDCRRTGILHRAALLRHAEARRLRQGVGKCQGRHAWRISADPVHAQELVLKGTASANLNTKEGALASTARFLVGHGWERGEGYQPGQPNFGAIQGWNAATVYQQAIAIMGKQIDGN